MSDQQDEIPCEGCPDPGMPCLGCPAVDEQASELSGISGELNDEQPSCVACGRGQAGDKHTCQQVECPKAFYCLPESCGDCPRAEGERAATERIAAGFSQMIDGERPSREQIIEAIHRFAGEGRA